jgi:DNA-binding NtrC family response regulator
MQVRHPDLNLAEAVRMHILQTLTYCKGNRTRAAKRLGISVRCLRDKLRHYSESGFEIPAHPCACHRSSQEGIVDKSLTGMQE